MCQVHLDGFDLPPHDESRFTVCGGTRSALAYIFQDQCDRDRNVCADAAVCG